MAVYANIQVVHNIAKVTFSKGFGDFDLQIIIDMLVRTFSVIALFAVLYMQCWTREVRSLSCHRHGNTAGVHASYVCVCVCAPIHMGICQYLCNENCKLSLPGTTYANIFLPD